MGKEKSKLIIGISSRALFDLDESHEIYKKEICVAPISTLAHHISRSVPSINEDWQRTWDLNYQKFKKNYS